MISLKIEGQADVLKAFDKVSDPARRYDLMDLIGSYGASSTQQRFIDGKDPDGIKWVPSLRAIEQSGQTLRDTNRLYDSITHDANETSAEWGSNVIYAGIHQFGGTIRAKSAGGLKFRLANGQFVVVDKVEMPARPFLGINVEDEKEISALTQDWLQEAFQ